MRSMLPLTIFRAIAAAAAGPDTPQAHGVEPRGAPGTVPAAHGALRCRLAQRGGPPGQGGGGWRGGGGGGGGTRWAGRVLLPLPCRSEPLANGGQDGGGSADGERRSPAAHPRKPRLPVSHAPAPPTPCFPDDARPPNGSADNALSTRSAALPQTEALPSHWSVTSGIPPTFSFRVLTTPLGRPPSPAPQLIDSCGRGLLWVGRPRVLLRQVPEESGSTLPESKS